jgi:mono/diheme cytochrome c family protein
MTRLLAFIGILAIIAGVAAAIFFFGGFYDVGAAAGHPEWVKSSLARMRQASIERHAKDRLPPMTLDDAATIRLGARAYSQRGCVACHGGPGANWEKFSEGLQPGPPDLKELAHELSPQHIFWVVKNGINMTGMPSFGAIEVPDQEIWSIVAFVKKLPNISDQDFKTWSAPATAPQAQ